MVQLGSIGIGILDTHKRDLIQTGHISHFMGFDDLAPMGLQAHETSETRNQNMGHKELGPHGIRDI